MDEIKFASLLCSRLCHDLVSPVGAMANGVEILADEKDPAMVEQIMELLGQSAGQTSARLQFYRLAFGAAGGFGAELDLGDVRQALQTFFSGTKVSVEWNAPAATISKDVAKLILNLALIAGEALIRGGSLGVDISVDGAVRASVAVAGDRLILPDNVIAVLGDGTLEDDIDPRAVPALLAMRLAKATGTTISVDHLDEKSLTLSVE